MIRGRGDARVGWMSRVVCSDSPGSNARHGETTGFRVPVFRLFSWVERSVPSTANDADVVVRMHDPVSSHFSNHASGRADIYGPRESVEEPFGRGSGGRHGR